MEIMDKKEQKEKILMKLDELYSFRSIQDFISINEIIVKGETFSESVWRIKEYISEELFAYSGREIVDRIGNEKMNQLSIDISTDKFIEKMTNDIE